MKHKARLFAAGFMITAIFIGALCGFALVDLTTDRYMPGQFAPMFEVSALNSDEFAFSFMGGAYRFSLRSAQDASRLFEPYRGLLPAHIRAGQYAALQLYERTEAALEEWRNRD